MISWSVAGLLAGLLSGFAGGEPAGWSGYVEGEFLYLGAVSGGRIASVAVSEGAHVAASAPLFALDARLETAALAAATARADLARASYKRTTTLPADVASGAQRDAASAALAAAQAEAEAARVALDQRTVAAPQAGRVERVYYQSGEIVAAGAPVLALLPAQALEVIFYLPQEARGRMELGARLTVSCENCPEGLTATLTELSENAQYTPPILYSREERARLVWRAKAALPAGISLLAGQPVSITEAAK